MFPLRAASTQQTLTQPALQAPDLTHRGGAPPPRQSAFLVPRLLSSCTRVRRVLLGAAGGVPGPSVHALLPSSQQDERHHGRRDRAACGKSELRLLLHFRQHRGELQGEVRPDVQRPVARLPGAGRCRRHVGAQVRGEAWGQLCAALCKLVWQALRQRQIQSIMPLRLPALNEVARHLAPSPWKHNMYIACRIASRSCTRRPRPYGRTRTR
jgi:hypothetical protein